MILNFSESEMGMIISSLDFYMRMYIGQYREILFDLRWYRDCSYLDNLEDQLRIKFMQIRNILLPDITGYGWSGSYGIFNPDVDEVIIASFLAKASILSIMFCFISIFSGPFSIIKSNNSVSPFSSTYVTISSR